MSVTVSFPAGLKTEVITPSTTAKTSIMTTNERTQRYIDTIRATNTTGSGATLALHFESTISGGAEGLIRPAASIAASTSEIIAVGVAMRQGDILKATVGTADAIDLIITYAERTGVAT